MHPLQALNESELNKLTRVADRLFNTSRLLAPGHRPNPQRSGFGIEFLDHREYRAGDDIKSIDWRSSARSRHPQIRRYHEEASADWFITLDCSASMTIGEGRKWALALQCAAAMAYLLIHLGNRAGLLLFSDRVHQLIPPGRGNTHYANLLQTLHRITPPGSGGDSRLHCCVPRIKRHSPVIVISDFLTPDHMQDGLGALSIRGDRLHSLQILSDQDTVIPAGEVARFKDVETGQSLCVDLDEAQRERYRMALDRFNASLTRYCKKQGIHFSRHSENEEWKTVLINHFRGSSNPS